LTSISRRKHGVNSAEEMIVGRSDVRQRSSIDKRTACLSLLLLSMVPASGAVAADADSVSMPESPALREIVLPLPDPAKGQQLFVTKGCFVCHAVNGIGGTAAPALDAPEDLVRLDVLRFAARMWWGALAMLELQNLELGYEIKLDGSEIADLAAFAASAETQQSFSVDDIPEIMRPLMIDEPYWMGDDWPGDFKDPFDDGLRPFDRF